MTTFRCFINVMIKKEPKKSELDTNVAKVGNSAFFCDKQQILLQMANSKVQCENLCAVEYCWP